jgi:cytochrome oxidase Cu insertion factor (SCO1/SenC/PrrC family)
METPMSRIILAASLALALAVPAATALAHDAAKHRPPPGPSQAYAFPLAKPGTYALPPIKQAAGGQVLDEQGRSHDLAELVQGQTTLLAFIYTRCGDVCPLATMRMADLRELATGHPEIAKGLRFVSMSFDPDYDTPAHMAEHAELWRRPIPGAPDWLFVTAPDRTVLQPILEAYGQTMTPKANPSDPNGPIRHILRVFLIDRAGRTRNIYSLDFLDPQLVLNDVATLKLEETAAIGQRAPAPSQ